MKKMQSVTDIMCMTMCMCMTWGMSISDLLSASEERHCAA